MKGLGLGLGKVVPCLEGDKINSELFEVNFSLLQSHFLRDASCQAAIEKSIVNATLCSILANNRINKDYAQLPNLLLKSF